MFEIITAKKAGFCYGVRKSVALLQETVQKYGGKKKIYLIGKTIHNKSFMSGILSDGVILVDDDKIDGFALLEYDVLSERIRAEFQPNSILVIRAHGVQKNVLRAFNELDAVIVDTTCADIQKIYRLLEENTDNETLTVIIGDDAHPEIKGIKSYAHGDVLIYASSDRFVNDFDNIRNLSGKKSKIICLSQTTHNKSDFSAVKDFVLSSEIQNVQVYDTICAVTESRQKEAEELSKICDIMIVVGSPESSNTRKIFEICSKNCKDTYMIETSEQLPSNRLKQATIGNKAVKVGITAGASTPDGIIMHIIKEVENRMTVNPNMDSDTGEMSFEEMLNLSFVTLNRGERVKGIVSSISANEIHVDLGTKYTGILSFDEITDDSSMKLDMVFHVGDEIETQVIKINDQDGTATLSKKRIDSNDNWDKIVKTFEDNTVIEGKIVQAVNGGLIAISEAVKLFIPASQANVTRDTDLKTLIGKTVKMKIIDVNIPKHRAIASIRNAYRETYSEEKREAETRIWGEIEVGKQYDGVVKSLVNYGAFVDIGGVDGMVHITELAWSRVKHPSDVLSVGDKVKVYIKDFDREKKRISLGYKSESDNPWTKFVTDYKVGDDVDVKIINNMPFGSFAQIIPGIDGLIHISQIADRKISKPSEVLNIGDVVKVRITEINEADKRISLSMRALLEPQSEEVVKEQVDELNAQLNAEGPAADAAK